MSVLGVVAPVLLAAMPVAGPAAAPLAATEPTGVAPVLASFAPTLSGLPWREALMMISPIVGTLMLRRTRR